MTRMWCVWLLFSFVLLFTYVRAEQNLSCYQCIKTVEEQCGEESLKKCSPKHDRCVTHITKTAKDGFKIKRECGLGPCSFDDDMASKGLGMDHCDRSKDELFCLSCCTQSGCNKSSAANPLIPTNFSTFLSMLVLLFSFVKCNFF